MTRALILAAGQGKRLFPVTNSIPKCLVELAGKPLLLRQIDTLKSCGVTDIKIVTGHLSEKIDRLGLCTVHNPRFARTNMVASLFLARDFLVGEEDLIISYGDIVYTQSNLRTLLSCKGDLAVMVDANWRALWAERMDDPLADAESMKLDHDGNIIELGEKVSSYDNVEGQYTGLLKLGVGKGKDLIQVYDNLDLGGNYRGRDFDNMYLTTFIQILIDSGWLVRASIVDSGWLELDSLQDLRLYTSLYEQNRLDRFLEI